MADIYTRALRLKLEKPTIRPRQAARELGVSTRQVRQYWQQGKRPPASKQYQDTLGNFLATPSGVRGSIGTHTMQYDWLVNSGYRAADIFTDGNSAGLGRAYNLNAIVYRCTEVRAHNIAKLPIKIMLRSGDDTIESAYNDPILQLILGNYELLYHIALDRTIYGTAYLTLEYDSDGFYLQRHNPAYVTPQYTGRTIKSYFVSNPYGETETIDADAMIAFDMYDPENDLSSRSPVAVALQQIRTNSEQWGYVERFFSNDAMPSMAITYPATETPSEREKEKVQAQFAERFGGLRNKHRAAILTRGMTLSPVASNRLRDLIVPEINDSTMRQICIAIGVPMVIALATDSANFATAQVERQTFYEETILPEARLILGILNRRLLGDMLRADLELEIDLGSITVLQEDQTQLAARIQGLFETGIISHHEAREKLGYTTEGEDAYKFNQQLVKVTDIADGKYLAPPAVPAPSFNPFGRSEHAPNCECDTCQTPTIPQRKVIPLTPYRDTVSINALRAYKKCIQDDLDKYERAYRKRAENGTANRFIFEGKFLPQSISSLIRFDLEAGGAIESVFGAWREVAKVPTRTYRAIEPIDGDFATLEEVAAFWQNLDDVYDGLKDIIQVQLETLLVTLTNAYIESIAPDGFWIIDAPPLINKWVAETLQVLTQPETETGDISPILAAWAAGGATATSLLEGIPVPEGSPVEQADIRQAPAEIIINWDLLMNEAVEWLQRGVVSDLLAGVAQTSINRIQAASERLLELGRPQSDLAAYIQDEITAANNGINTIAGIERASRIAQDIMTHTYANAVQDKWSQAGVNEIIWRTANDPRVCALCRSLNNGVGQMGVGVRGEDGNFHLIPAHNGCRCFYAPVLPQRIKDALNA